MAVVNLGPLPTPMVYYAARRTHADGFAAICASNENGSSLTLKWLIGETIPDTEQVATLKKAVENEDVEAKKNVPEVRSLDVTYDYVAWLQDTWFDSPGMKAQIVLDTCEGPWSGRARRYLQAVFPKLIFTELDTGGGTARSIAEEVDRTRAQLGFVLGKDGGQLSAVDGYGIPYDSNELNWLLVQSFGLSLQGEMFLHDSSCPPAILQSATRFGAATQEVSGGDAGFRRAMSDSSAIFGADSAGHHYFRALCGNNDALFTTCWVLDYLAHGCQTLAKLRETIPMMR